MDGGDFSVMFSMCEDVHFQREGPGSKPHRTLHSGSLGQLSHLEIHHAGLFQASDVIMPPTLVALQVCVAPMAQSTTSGV